MRRLLQLVLLANLALSGGLQAQEKPFLDPANLKGERPHPRTGRELPIDGGPTDSGSPDNALALKQLLRKLNTRASLMLIVAHPDDEDGGMLTFLSRGLGARVADLSLTRGEGGQNAVTGDFEDALGLIRTQELLAADRYSGTDQFFGTEVDFGFSKTKQEAFGKWTHERVLYDAVRAVRLYRPLVLAAVFIGGVTDGHGQHQVSGEIAQEVFKAAADPRIFPELTREGILPWAPLKVYARVPSFAIQSQGLFDYATNQFVPPSFTNYVTGITTKAPPTPDVVVHEGANDPLLTNAAAHAPDLPNPHADPRTPLSYVQFSRIGLGLQRTQIGPGVRLAAPGTYDVAYHLYGSRLCNAPASVRPPLTSDREACVPPANSSKLETSRAPDQASFFDGIDTSLGGLSAEIASSSPALAEQLTALSDRLQSALTVDLHSPNQPAELLRILSDALRRDEALLAATERAKLPFTAKATMLHELRVKHVQLNDALVVALGISVSTALETTSPNECHDAITPFCVAHVNTLVTNGPVAPVEVISDYTGDGQHPRAWGGHKLAPGERLWPERSFIEQGWLPASLSSSSGKEQPSAVDELHQREGRPYFSRSSPEQPVYDLSDPALRLAPAAPAEAFWTQFRYNGVDLLAGHVVTNSGNPADPGSPLRLVPALSLSLPVRAAVCPGTPCAVHVAVQLRATSASHLGGEVKAQMPPGWTAKSVPGVRSPNVDNAANFALTLSSPPKHTASDLIQFETTNNSGSPVTEGYRMVGYPGLVPTPLYSPATLRVVPVNLTLPSHRRIGYLAGTGDAVADNLRSIGFEVTDLAVRDLTPERLQAFDSVVLGVRTYNAHPDLHGAPTQALLTYARNGGNVVVQYQTSEFTAADAPYPLSLGAAEKVVDETTPVRLLDPESPALSGPNRITAADFNGWIEERGHGFLAQWDREYTALTETRDPGAPSEHIAPQLPQRGGLLVASLGKGHWTYCAFALYRQLPVAVPGAFRLLTNLLALSEHP